MPPSVEARCRKILAKYSSVGFLPKGETPESLLPKLIAEAEEYGDSHDLALLSAVCPRLVAEPDNECIYEDGDYVEFLAPIVALARDVLGDIEVTSSLNYKTATLTFRAKDRTHTFSFDQDSDWVNSDELYTGLNEFAKDSGYHFTLIPVDDGVAGFLTPEEVSFLREEGLEPFTRTAPPPRRDPCPRCGEKEIPLVGPDGKTATCTACGNEMPFPETVELKSPYAPEVHQAFVKAFRETWAPDRAMIEFTGSRNAPHGASFGAVFGTVTSEKQQELDFYYVTPHPWTPQAARDATRDLTRASWFMIERASVLRYHFLSPHPVPEDVAYLFGASTVARFERKARQCLPMDREVRTSDMSEIWKKVGRTGLVQILGISEKPQVRELVLSLERTLIHRLHPPADEPVPEGWTPQATLLVISAVLGRFLSTLNPGVIEASWVEDDGCLHGLGLKLRNPKSGFEHVWDLTGGVAGIYHRCQEGLLSAFLAGAIQDIQKSRPPKRLPEEASASGSSRRWMIVAGVLGVLLFVAVGVIKIASKAQPLLDAPPASPEPAINVIPLGAGKEFRGREVLTEKGVITLRVEPLTGAVRVAIAPFDPLATQDDRLLEKEVEVSAGQGVREIALPVEKGFYIWSVRNASSETVEVRLWATAESGAP